MQISLVYENKSLIIMLRTEKKKEMICYREGFGGAKLSLLAKY